jgi:small subunit ribosomal protein S1
MNEELDTEDMPPENNHDPEEPGFAELLQQYDRASGKELQIGDRIQGDIIAIDRDTVFVDTGTGTDGVVEKAGLLDESGMFSFQVGDRVDLYVVAVTEEEIRLSRALSGTMDQDILREAYETKIPVSGKVSGVCKGGFTVEIMKLRAFCPVSQMDTRPVTEMDGYVGLTDEFRIIQYSENGKNIVVSRKQLLVEQQSRNREEFLKNLTPDSVVEGTVTRIQPYGAFIELLPGLEGMAHASEISWSYATHPEEVLSIGQRVQVKITDVGTPDKNGRPRLSLSIKQMEEDPWRTVPDRFREGDRAEGRVTRMTHFGAFVEIAPGVEGLIHISEMSHTKRITRPEELLQVGDSVSVTILEIDSGRRRVSLSLKDTETDPWADIEQRYRVGSRIEAMLEKKEKAGYVFLVEPGISGFLPRSLAQNSESGTRLETAKPGMVVSLEVMEISSEKRRMILGLGDGAPQEDWKTEVGPVSASLGSLGDKLKEAMASVGSPRQKLHRKHPRKHEYTSAYRPKG